MQVEQDQRIVFVFTQTCGGEFHKFMGVICSGDVIVICQMLDTLGADMANMIGVEQKEREHHNQQQNGHDEHKHHLLIALIDVVGRNYAHQIPVVIAKRVDGSPVLPSGILKRECIGALRGNGLLEFFYGSDCRR